MVVNLFTDEHYFYALKIFLVSYAHALFTFLWFNGHGVDGGWIQVLID